MVSDILYRYRDERLRQLKLEGKSVVWLFNMNVADEWGQPSQHFISRLNESVMSPANQWNELGVLNSFLARNGDILILNEEAKENGLFEYWESIGLKMPNINAIYISNVGYHTSVTQAMLQVGNLDRVRYLGADHVLSCFGYSQVEEQFSLQTGLPLMGSPPDIAEKVNSKAVVKDLCSQLGLPTPAGRVCYSTMELEETSLELFRSFNKIVVKEPYGSSGKGMIIVKSMDRIFKLASKFVNQDCQLEHKLCWIVEGWYEDISCSHNTQYLIYPSGEIVYMGTAEQILKKQVYEGNIIESNWRNSFVPLLKDQQLEMVRHIAKQGYHGLAGIDSLLRHDGTAFPVIEINGRINMSTYAFVLLDRLGHTSNAVLKTYTLKCTEQLSLKKFIRQTGEDIFFKNQSNHGIIILGFTGCSSPQRIGILRLNLLFLGPSQQKCIELQEELESKLALI